MPRKIIAVLLTALSAIYFVPGCWGETPEQFYRGKTLSIMTGSPGGNADVVSRVLVPYLEKELKANVIIRNLPGGGVLQTENLAFRAKPDGLTLLNMDPSSVALSTWFNEPGSVFDVAKFNWLSQLAFEPAIFGVSPQKSYQSYKDLQQAKRLKFGTGSPLSWFGCVNMMLCDILKLDAKVISGFKGAAALALSFQKGELDGGVVSESMAQRTSSGGQLKPLFVFYGESKLFGNLPSFRKEVKLTKEQAEIMEVLAPTSKAIATSPGVPAARIAFLRKAFKKVCENPNLQKDMVVKGDFGAWYKYVPGEELQKQMSQPQIGQAVKNSLEKLMDKYLER